MDFRVGKFAKERVQPLADEGLRVALEQAPRAEAFTERVEERTRGVRSWFGRMQRKLATVGVLVLAVWLVAHATFADNGIVQYQRKHAEYERLVTEKARLEAENGSLLEIIKSLKTDKRAIEKVARELLHYVRPGEVVYVAPEPANPNSTEPKTAQK